MVMRFRMGCCVMGLLRLPNRHMSKQHLEVLSTISCTQGTINMDDPKGRSIWKCGPDSCWNRNITIARASCQRLSHLSCMIFSLVSKDLWQLKRLQAHHGPHSGLYQRFCGWYRTMLWNNFFLESSSRKAPRPIRNEELYPPDATFVLWFDLIHFPTF